MVAPKKSFGQHFLHDHAVIEKIMAAAEPEQFACVVEVGPGTGALTSAIVTSSKWQEESGRQLVLIEADKELVSPLRERYPFAHIILADAASVDYGVILSSRHAPLATCHLSLVTTTPWLLVGNLPYNAASAIIMQALQSTVPPARLVVMVQKEVGERMLALPGAIGVLSVAIGMYAAVEKVCIVKPGAFNPPPKVDSMVLRLTPHNTPHGAPERVIALAKAGFASRRKFLSSNLAKAKLADALVVGQWLAAQGFSPKARAEELTVAHWAGLAGYINASAPRV